MFLPLKTWLWSPWLFSVQNVLSLGCFYDCLFITGFKYFDYDMCWWFLYIFCAWVCWASWICGFWSFTKTTIFLANISSNIFYQLPPKLFASKPKIACIFGLLTLSYHTLMLLFIFCESLFFLCGFISFSREVSSIHYFFSIVVLNILSVSSGIFISDTVLFFFKSLTWVFVCCLMSS